MKKFTKHLAAIAMAMAVAITTIAPATVQAAPSFSESSTTYMTSTTSTGYTSLYIDNLGKSDTIKKSSVKSSNTKVAKLYSLHKYSSSSEYNYFSSSSSASKSNSYYYYVGIDLLKAGKSTISFKIGSKTYNSTITVLKYENPLKTATILGKDYAGKLKKSNSYTGIKAKKTQKNQTFTFAANKNWKITSVSVCHEEKASSSSYYYNTTHSQSWYYSSSPKSKVTCSVGTITKGNYYSVSVYLTNTKTGGSMSVYYSINYPY